MDKIALSFLVGLTFVFAGFAQAAKPDAAAKAAKNNDENVKVIVQKADSAKAPVRGGPNDKNALWWNDPEIIESLKLTDEQRKKMDGHLKTYRETVPRDRSPKAFHETLVQGNWKNARKESEKVADLAVMSVRKRGELKIDVLSLLSKEQLQLLVDRYPRLIYKPWRRAMGEAPKR